MKRTKRISYGRASLKWLAGLFVVMNLIAAMHAWKFTHFAAPDRPRLRSAAGLSFGQIVKFALTGIDNPRPVSAIQPDRPFRTVMLQSGKKISCWYMQPRTPARGTVLLFHGYGGERSFMLSRAYILLDSGYNVLLPDFMGSGASEGVQTTIGFKEGQDVRTCYEYIRGLGERHIILLGTSMGAAAILKYLHDGNPQPAGIIIECPFGSMYQTVCARFRMVHMPSFPGAAFLVFWGGLENGFWAFGHNPAEYASSVHCPAMLIFGAKDDRVTREETDDIFNHLQGPKKLVIYPEAGHAMYLKDYRKEWTQDVCSFIRPL